MKSWMINVLSRNISPMWIAYLHLSHSITMSAMQHSHTKTESLSARGLRCRLAQDIDRLSARVPVYRWLVEGCLVSCPPLPSPRPCQCIIDMKWTSAPRNLTTPGKVAISKLAIGNWRLSSFHRSLGSDFFQQELVQRTLLCLSAVMARLSLPTSGDDAQQSASVTTSGHGQAVSSVSVCVY